MSGRCCIRFQQNEGAKPTDLAPLALVILLSADFDCENPV